MRAVKNLVLGVALVLAAGAAVAPLAFAAEHLTGTVTTTSGQPARSRWVVVSQGSAEKGRSLSGDDGKYYVGNLPPGDYQVQVRQGDTVLLRSTVRLPAPGPVDLRLP